MNRNNSPPLMPALQLSIRAALAAGVAVAVAELLRLPHPLYAMIGAVIVSDLSPSKTRQLGRQRLAGSVLGATVGAVLCHFLPSVPWAIGCGVLVAMFLSHLLRLPDAARLSGFLCGIVMIGYEDDAWSYAFYRLLETILGVGLALIVSFTPKLIPIEEPKPDS